jgi:hypothetical protein
MYIYVIEHKFMPDTKQFKSIMFVIHGNEDKIVLYVCTYDSDGTHDSFAQWAAVKNWWSEMRVAPH